ncbi:MAG: cyclic nucleotide-binding domain-containing protein [Spirochaetaceae bacterium]|nr:cyclic nucleotide-binding domain-containing protein [Spirochaetaceae bacterium]
MAGIKNDIREFDTGQEIFTQAESAGYMCVLVSGAVSLTRKTDKGEKMLKIITTPNEFFGEMALLTGQPHEFTALATRPTKILVIDEANFERIVCTNGKFALKIIRSLAQRFLDSSLP